jgi:hypothetical protein
LKATQELGQLQFNQRALKEAAPPNFTPTEVGKTGVDQLKNAFNKAYDEAWGKAKKPPQKMFDTFLSRAAKRATRLDADSKKVLKNFAIDANRLKNVFSGDRLRQLDTDLRNAADRAFKQGDMPLNKALKGMRDDLRTMVSKKTRDKLAEIDPQYRKYKEVRKAALADTRRGGEGVFSPQQLAAAGRGEGSMLPLAQKGTRVLGEQPAEPIMSQSKAFLERLPVLGSRQGARAFVGETAPQQFAKKIHQSPFAKALRDYASVGRISGSLSN